MPLMSGIGFSASSISPTATSVVSMSAAIDTAFSSATRDTFTGSMMPREDDQYYPGEQGRRGTPRRMFNNLCGFCHAALSGSELPVATSPDVLTLASQSYAVDDTRHDLRIAPADRAPPE